MVAKLARKGGKTVRKAMEKILSSLLSNELMTSMNWTGACGKTAYSKLKCCELVQRKSP
jgi:hypothetical protein